MQAPLFFEQLKQQIDEHLLAAISDYSDNSEHNSRLAEALRYSTLLGGKRIRPILSLTTARCFGVAEKNALSAACAIEMIHAYSLVHDDLPAMDNDDLRRGQPTCHIAFDEATAILAGDALQAMAFELLTQPCDIPSDKQLQIIRTLAAASGAKGMVLGQAIDLASVGQTLTLEQLETMHNHKTGALIEASVVIGGLCAGSSVTANDIAHLKTYAQALGLAFQVQDDILDVTSDTETLGKQQGADIALNKPTYPSLLGLDGAKEKLATLHKTAQSALSEITSHDTSELLDIANFVVNRSL